MINNNKILTVSYGTFSYTLEGFDDSFGTMKAIAEYFRDLSADDRYFGAEPVQPDAQMLARIAEREISRHVEAREDKGRIVLSAQSSGALTADTPPQTSDESAQTRDSVQDAESPAVTAPAAQAKATDGSKSNETPEAADAPEAKDTPDTKAEADTDTAPARKVIKKVGKPVARTAPAAAAPENEPVAAPKPQATAPADEAARTEEAPAPPRADPQTAKKSDIVPSLPDDEVEAFFAESASTATRQRFETKDTPAASQPRARSTAEPASIADKLSRIRAVVSQQSNAADAPDFSEDQHADATVAPATKIADVIADEAKPEALASEKDVLADTLRDLEDALEEDDHSAAQDAATDIADETEDDDIAAILNRLDAEAAPEAEDAPAADTFDADDADTDDLDEDTLVGHGIDAADDDAMDQQIMAAMDSLQANPGLDDLDDLPAVNIFDKEHETAPEPAPALEAPEPAARPAPPRARVLKVKRATLEAAIEAGQLEEYDDDDEDEAPRHSAQPQVRGHSSLSEEAEAELARELAELEADMKADDTAEVDAQAEAEIAAQAEAEAEARAAEEKRAAQETFKARAKISSAAEDDLTRLMEESKSKMEEPEAATRRDAFSHLRAAVASKKADEATGGARDDSDSDEAYRDDLASIVRPRRPVSSGAERPRTQRPAEPKPAPLKLVAEQRIDVDQSHSAAPVRPRRVSAMAPAAAAPVASSDADNFADFASEMGASTLPDLLEAAAYLSFVEGHEEFSRPQLMTKVRQVEQSNFTREDSLRSFGKLLREGKIEKLKGGRFQASDQIGFKPDTRAVG